MWVMILSEFDIKYVDKKSIKGQVVADQLDEAPIEDHQPLLSKFLDEGILVTTQVNCWKLYFDGSHSQHGSGADILFLTPQGDSIPKASQIAFPCINNIAEYEALITRLK